MKSDDVFIERGFHFPNLIALNAKVKENENESVFARFLISKVCFSIFGAILYVTAIGETRRKFPTTSSIPFFSFAFSVMTKLCCKILHILRHMNEHRKKFN